MATRRRSSGFSEQTKEEMVSVEELLDESAREMFETISRAEEELDAKKEEKAEAPLPVIFPEVTPTEDVGPRFVEESPAPCPQAVTPQLQPPPKRHPRNIPKFSRFK